jgi:hypothetical protein
MNAPGLSQPAATVKVRFYGQLFRSDMGDYPVGDSFLIGERELGPIPGYASTTTPGDAPNWLVAVQAFDPQAFAKTRNGGVYVRFWVVVWMEDAAGNLVQEMAGHGLTADPQLATINTMGDVAVEPYSNNVGTFKQVFYVQGPAGLAGPVVAASEPPTLALASLVAVPPTPSPPAAGPLGKHLLTTVIGNGAAAQEAVQVRYYDGDPAHGGRLFDWELIPYLAAGAQYVNRVMYTPQACGERTIYVTAGLGTGEVSNSTQIANVPCVMILPIIGKN